ncbi:MAG: DUF2505 domain-containing protein [Acidimicrobiia bacterium]
MDLDRTHTFLAPVAAVAHAMADPEFYSALRLANVEPPIVLETSAVGTTLQIRVAYQYSGSINPFARSILGTDQFSWEQALTIDATTGLGTLRIVPAVQPGAMHCEGTVQLVAIPEGTRRTLTAQLRIRIPLLGGRAERAIAPEILKQLDVEAQALETYLSG